CWPAVEDGLRQLFEVAAAPVEAPWEDGLFLKDVAAARLQAIPGDSRACFVDRPSWRAVLRGARLRDRARVAAYIPGAFLHRGFFWSRHEWRGYRAVLRTPTDESLER